MKPDTVLRFPVLALTLALAIGLRAADAKHDQLAGAYLYANPADPGQLRGSLQQRSPSGDHDAAGEVRKLHAHILLRPLRTTLPRKPLRTKRNVQNTRAA